MFMRSLFAGLAVGVVLMSALPVRAAAPPDDAPEALVNKVYPVADLVVPLREFASNSKEAPPRTLEDNLIRLIESTICPRTWGCLGGEGSINYFPIGMALVVRQTPDVHDELQDLLSALRRLQDVEVTVELRFLTVSDECLEKLGVSERGEAETKVLDDTQVRLLLETVQSDPATNIMQAPRMTVFNGQKAVLDLSEKQCFVTGVEFVPLGDRKVPNPQTRNVNTGLQVSVLPVVGPDNRTVSLRLGVNLARADAPRAPAGPMMWTIKPDLVRPMLIPPQVQSPPSAARAFETTLRMSDGGTVLLTGWTHHREVRNLVAAPVLSKVPYINQLFRNFTYGKEREHLLVMVTSHVVVRREQDEPESDQQENKKDTPATPVPEAKPAVPEVEVRHTKPQSVTQGARNAAWEVETETSLIPTPEVSPVPAGTVPQSPPVMHVNRRSFRLDYALDNVGPTGVSKVAVWYKHGAGGWMQYEQEVPAKGHATITVPEDGRWGFTLIPFSGAGLSAAPPKAGEQPRVWVEVDTLAPHVAILSASASLVHGEPVLCVQYHTDDAHLKTRPVTISYAAAPEGPWTVLATGQAAADRFSCSLKGLPHEFYVRVEAEDQAGNVGRAAELIKADLKIPTVREVKVKAEE